MIPGVGCCLVLLAAIVILILVNCRHRNPTYDGIRPASPPFSSPPRRRRALSTLSIAQRHLGPACGVNALRYNAASAAPAHTPLLKHGKIAPAPPSRPPRCLGLLTGGRRWTLLLFLGCCRRSGVGDGSTLRLMLVPGAFCVACARTCTELSWSLHGACTQTCKVLYQSTYAGFFGI